ncbi:DNA primase [Marinicrinis lubricantis]|uniref:DNA primase n=1 Tax=Marinicrinis lubricantis TaxID=2086470 RepID=A0ABW1IUW1_9BACL
MNSGMIPEETIRAVLQAIDIVDVVGRTVSLSKSGRTSYKGLCPFHSEKTPSFHVNQEKQVYKCFGCGAGGDAIRFVMEVEGLSFPESVAFLAEEAGIPVQWDNKASEDTPEQREMRMWLEAYELTAKFYEAVLNGTEQGKPAKQYLVERGFTDKMIRTFRIGFAPAFWDKLSQVLESKGYNLSSLEQGGLVRHGNNGYLDLFRERIIFPIHNHQGRIIAFAGRVLHSDQQPKYLNTPETKLFHKSKVLYNLHQARPYIRKKNQIVLFEGYADVIKAWEAGVDNGVAAMGTSLTSEHASMMKRYAAEVILCYDGDEAGQKAAYKNLQVLEQSGLHVKVAMLPPRMDPDEYIMKHGNRTFMTEIIGSPLTSTQFKLQWFKRKYNLNQPDSKLAYIRSSLHIISQLQAPSERELYLKELSRDCDIEIATLKQEMHEMRQENQKKQRIGDNIQKPWNNVMNDRKSTPAALKPAYYHAERNLLYLMMHSRELTLEVQEQLGDQLNVEVHAALAAYLYAYFAQNSEADVSRFVSTLQEDELVRTASTILMMEPGPEYSPEIITEYIRTIQIVPKQKWLEQKKQEMLQAEKIGDVAKAIQLGSEIITLERQLKDHNKDRQ